MKIKIVNSKVKHKTKNSFGSVKNLALDFIIFFATAHMRKYPIHVMSAQGTKQNKLYII